MLPPKLYLPVINKEQKKKQMGKKVDARSLPVNGPSFHPSGFLTSSFGI